MTTLEVVKIAICVILSYVAGSMPFGYWWGKHIKGPKFDIRNYGTFSIGFTNVLRVLGIKAAIPVLFLDIAKGYLPTLAGLLAGKQTLGWACLVAVMLGHAFSLYFRIKEKHFSGGKSVASALGGILALQPAIAGLSLVVFLLLLLTVRVMSVASMVGAASAVVLSHYLFHLGLGWDIFFGAVAGLIVFFHRRNIGRIVHGLEKPLFEWKDVKWPWQKRETKVTNTTEEVKIAFVVHPMGWSDLRQSILSWLLSWLGMFKVTHVLGFWILSHMPVIENAEVTGIQVNDGRHVRILTSVIAFLPRMIEDTRLAVDVESGKIKIGAGPGEVSQKQFNRSKRLRDQLWQRLQSAAVQARRRGATVFGLGALLSTVFNGGADLQKWCNERGLDLIIDNGAAYTAVATVEAIEKESRVPIRGAKVTVAGATGFIGRITVKYLELLGAIVVALGRDPAKLSDFGAGVKTSVDIADSYDSDVVVLVTNSPTPIVNLVNCLEFSDGTVFADASRPVGFQREILRDHPEKNFKLVGCGVIDFPEDPETGMHCGMEFHFGCKGNKQMLPACVAQAVMVALGGEEGARNATRGARVSEDNFRYFARMAKFYGLTVITSIISEGQQFAGTEFPSN